MGRHNLDELAAGVADEVGGGDVATREQQNNSNKGTGVVTRNGAGASNVANTQLGGTGTAHNYVQFTEKGGYTDVMNFAGAPGVGTDSNSHFNIDDAAWTEDKWQSEDLALNLPPASDVTGNDPCMSDCQRRALDREKKCQILRQRVQIALERAGCPSVINPGPPPNSSGCGSCGSCNLQNPTPVYTSSSASAPAPAPTSSCAGGTVSFLLLFIRFFFVCSNVLVFGIVFIEVD